MSLGSGMNVTTNANRKSPLALLGRLARGADPAGERCDFCSASLGPVHRHLLETAEPKIVCVCDACGLRFQSAVGRYRLIPRDVRGLPDFRITDEQWAALGLPINLVFMFRNSAQARVVVLYPSPAGVTESLLPISTWEELAAANPALARMEPDVEALLVNRIGEAREYYLAPIDRCYELAGLVRLNWRGFSGGEKAWQAIDRFFTGLRSEAPPGPGIEKREGVCLT